MTPQIPARDTSQDAALAIKRALFPLRAPRAQTLAWWPVTLLCAAVDGYYEAFFANLPGRNFK